MPLRSQGANTKMFHKNLPVILRPHSASVLILDSSAMILTGILKLGTMSSEEAVVIKAGVDLNIVKDTVSSDF